MGFKCAPLGIGTDIGGSIRAPAAFCNAYGFRPTMRRNPCLGIKAPGSGQEAILGVVGPLAANSLEDLDLFQRVVIDSEPWDVETSLVPIPWRRVSQHKGFTVGIMWDDGYCLSFFSLHCFSIPVPESPLEQIRIHIMRWMDKLTTRKKGWSAPTHP
jgi:Asp-tRNA(Asn)/Glu-tRNA(Gln) amidotransferase A subunit family amidase